MELKHLISYATVVRLGSFSRAAEELYIAQPTISLHIRQLEEELGTQLLVRTTKSIEMTEKGREVYECAVSILQLRDRIAEKCSGGERRIIRLCASTIPSAYILPEVLPAYVKNHPETYFTIDQGDSRSVTEKVAEGLTDIGLVGMKPASSDITAEPFYEDSVVIITPVREPFLTMKEQHSATLEKLFEQPVILREKGSGSLKAADTFLANAGYSGSDLHVAARTNDPEAIKNLVVSGLGISMISSKAAEDYSRENRLLVFSFPEISSRRQFYILKRKKTVLPECVRDFVQYLRQFYSKK
ncbi:MAG: LysR family transcriptional regulator [Clostridia bacterium]|nr:LysR family transcriptional regulator [Clostridia bacterium]